MSSYKVLIEIPKGTENNKFEFDHKTQKMVLDFVFTDLVWPFNYGEVVGTLGGDKDALDAMVFSTVPLEQSSIVDCIPFGIVKMLDRGEEDHKLAFVPVGDALAKKYKDIPDLSQADRQNIIKLYAKIAEQKQKTIEILGFGSKQETLAILQNSLLPA